MGKFVQMRRICIIKSWNNICGIFVKLNVYLRVASGEVLSRTRNRVLFNKRLCEGINSEHGRKFLNNTRWVENFYINVFPHCLFETIVSMLPSRIFIRAASTRGSEEKEREIVANDPRMRPIESGRAHARRAHRHDKSLTGRVYWPCSSKSWPMVDLCPALISIGRRSDRSWLAESGATGEPGCSIRKLKGIRFKIEVVFVGRNEKERDGKKKYRCMYKPTKRRTLSKHVIGRVASSRD